MSKSITITLPNNVFETLDVKMGKLAKSQVPGMNVSKSSYVTIAIKEKLLRDGEKLVEIKPAVESVTEPADQPA